MDQIQLQQSGAVSNNFQPQSFKGRMENQTNPIEMKKDGDKTMRNTLIALGTIAAAGVAIAKRKNISSALKKVFNGAGKEAAEKTAKEKAERIAKEAAERTAKEVAENTAAKEAQRRIFGAVDSSVGKSAEESAKVFMNAVYDSHERTTRSIRSKACYLIRKLKQDPTNRDLHKQIADLVGPVNLNQLVAENKITLQEKEKLQKLITQANIIAKI